MVAPASVRAHPPLLIMSVLPSSLLKFGRRFSNVSWIIQDSRSIILLCEYSVSNFPIRVQLPSPDLPYQSVLSCAATSRSILNDALPLVTKLHIDRPSQLNLRLAMQRLRDVRDIYIYSLLPSDSIHNERYRSSDQHVDQVTAIRAVPFLCGFSRLERVFFGFIKEDGTSHVGTFGAVEWFDGDNETSMGGLVNG